MPRDNKRKIYFIESKKINIILQWFRWTFAHYIKDVYKLNKLGKRN